MLRALGSPIETPDDAQTLLDDREAERGQRPVEPVLVAWQGQAAHALVNVPRRLSANRINGFIELEDGNEIRLAGGSARSSRGELALPRDLPTGYHRLKLEAPVEGSALLIVAPPECPPVAEKVWGVFMPLYAIRTHGNWGAGTFADLGRLVDWTTGLGGSTVGTLPLLAALLDEPFEPSPYSPASRLFWNELYIDVEAVPELRGAAEARSLVASANFRKEIRRLRAAPHVDYAALATLKRAVLAPLSESLATEPSSERHRRFQSFLRDRPEVVDYAAFRAVGERERRPWQEWPAGQRNGRIRKGDFGPGEQLYHEYVQWIADEQLAENVRTGPPGTGLYLDFPLGVHPSGYDTWKERSAFALDARGGAPPDMFFTKGQDWGFPPLHPDGIREQGYRYYIACVRNLMRHAAALRVDHVMGLHRMYWVPGELDARSGVYVRYRAEEFYAILCLEAHRAAAAVVGEDLGTVPSYVRTAMNRHGILRSYVLQLEALDPYVAVPTPVNRALASLNTHDMPPFAAFWEETDVDDRVRLGLLPENEADDERRLRERMRNNIARHLTAPKRRILRTEEALDAGHAFLSESDAAMVVVNAEDLWLEREPQNRPGTGPEEPNWTRKAARTLEEARSDPEVVGRLEDIDRRRRASAGSRPRTRKRASP